LTPIILLKHDFILHLYYFW